MKITAARWIRSRAAPGRSVSPLIATLWFVLLALASTAPALFGSRSLGPESLLDVDPLYAIRDDLQHLNIFDPSRTYYDLPRDFALAEGFRHGRLDLWNERVGCGMPLWAEAGAPFLPLKLPFYIAPSRRTYDLTAVLRLVVAGLGAYLLARRRGLDSVAAAAAGSLFELSGAMISGLPFGTGAPPCFLPWALLSATAIARDQSLAAAAGAGIVLGVAVSSGHPMLSVLVFAGFAAAMAGHGLAAWRRPRLVVALGGLSCLAVMLGLAIGATALLPLLEAWRESRSYKDTSIYENMAGNLLLRSRLSLPLALFAPATLRDALWTIFPYALAPTVGLAGLMLAVAGVLRRGLDTALVSVTLLGVGMTIAPPGLAWVRQLPMLHYVYSVYSWPLIALPLTQAAGRGVAALAARDRRSVLAALVLVLIGFLSLLLVEEYAPIPRFALPVRQVFLQAVGAPTDWLRLVLPPALAAISFAAIVLVAPAGRERLYSAAATALASIELIVSVAPAVWFRDSQVLTSPPSPALRFLGQRMTAADRMLGMPITVARPASPSLFGLADVRSMAALPVDRYVRYLSLISPSEQWYVWQHTADVMLHPLLDLAAVRYVVLQGAVNSAALENDPEVRLVYRDHHVAVYENAAALPRARIVHAAAVVGDPLEAAARLAEVAARGGHAATIGLADKVFVEPSDDGRSPPAALGGAATPSENVKILQAGDPDRVTLQAYLATPGYVVLADTFYPGWTAWIDEAPTPIHPADLLFRAVFVPAGLHTIVFQYDPPVFTASLVLFALGGAASATLLVHGRREQRRNQQDRL